MRGGGSRGRWNEFKVGRGWRCGSNLGRGKRGSRLCSLRAAPIPRLKSAKLYCIDGRRGDVYFHIEGWSDVGLEVEGMVVQWWRGSGKRVWSMGLVIRGGEPSLRLLMERVSVVGVRMVTEGGRGQREWMPWGAHCVEGRGKRNALWIKGSGHRRKWRKPNHIALFFTPLHTHPTVPWLEMVLPSASLHHYHLIATVYSHLPSTGHIPHHLSSASLTHKVHYQSI